MPGLAVQQAVAEQRGPGLAVLVAFEPVPGLVERRESEIVLAFAGPLALAPLSVAPVAVSVRVVRECAAGRGFSQRANRASPLPSSAQTAGQPLLQRSYLV